MLEGIQKSLAFDPQIFLFQVVLFIVLLVVMNLVFWKPLLTHLGTREQSIKDAYRTVEATRHDMENLRSEYQTRIAQIEAEARGRIQTAIKDAQTERERLIAEARAQSEATLRQGIADLDRERVESLEGLRGQMVGLAVNAAGKALGPVANADALRRSVETNVNQSANAARN